MQIVKEIVRLPTKGYFYSKESPLSKGFLFITPLTTYHEDILTSVNLKKGGHHINMILESIIQDDIDIGELKVADRNGIILAAYILSYGPKLPFNYDCPKCHEKFPVTVPLTKLDETVKDFSKFVKGNNRYCVKLPSKQTQIYFTNPPSKLIPSGKSDSSLEFIKAAVIQIGKEKKKEIIHEHLENMMIKDSRFLKKYIGDFFPNIKYQHTTKCPYCEYVSHIDFNSESLLDLPASHKADIHSEIFNMVYFGEGGFTLENVYDLPIHLRKFYARKLLDQKMREKSESENPGKKSSSSDKLPPMPVEYKNNAAPSSKK